MKSAGPSQTTAELMLAKTLLQEKNEAIEERDRTIRELRSALRDIKTSLQRPGGDRGDDRQEAVNRVLADIAHAVLDHGKHMDESEDSLAARILQMLHEKYRLEVMIEQPDAIDPELHQVVVVEDSREGSPAIEVIAPGLRIAGKLIRPMQVRVTRCETPAHVQKAGSFKEGSPLWGDGALHPEGRQAWGKHGLFRSRDAGKLQIPEPCQEDSGEFRLTPEYNMIVLMSSLKNKKGLP